MTEVAHLGPPPRVRWRERQTLRSADLASEQSYRLDARRRHARGAHRPGVISGLNVVAEPGGLAVTPGAAIDGQGRYILLRRPQSLAIETLADAHDQFGLGGEGEMIISIAPAIESPTRDRRVEGCRIELASATTFDVTPAHESSTEATESSAVPLASIVFDQGAGMVRFHRRISAGVVAHTVRDPLDRAQVRLHHEPEAKRVTVALGNQAGNPSGDLVERLAIDRNLDTVVTGDARSRGRVELARNSSGSGQRLRFGPVTATPEIASPWSLYRTDLEALNADGQPTGPVTPQLRVEFGGPSPAAEEAEDGDPRGFHFAIGHRVESSFVPCLKVDADCTTTVGNLRVEGQIVEGPIPADPNDPRYAEAAAESYLSGIGAALSPFAELGLDSTDFTDPPTSGFPVAFETTLRNAGPVAISGLSVTASLHDDQQTLQTIDLHHADQFPVDGVLDLKGEFDPVAVGTYTMVISASGVTSAQTPVTISDVVEVEVFPVVQ